MGRKLQTIVAIRSILDVAEFLDPPLKLQASSFTTPLKYISPLIMPRKP